jgi:hypothetical protein
VQGIVPEERHRNNWLENVKRLLGRPGHRWKDNNILDLKRNRVGRNELDSYYSRYRPVSGCCERGDEILGPITGGEFID